ncbi:protein fem-1 homolog C-like [Diadema antillarum]|uniref:protein fem-1 homolog C-like n=1 Tax=Diadema antillarum TaxID=105358 RepID=UPI003A8BC5F1
MESVAGSTDDTRQEGTPSLARAMQEGEVAGLESIQNYVASHTDEDGIDATASDGKTALMIACEKGQEDIVRFLLESGANPNVSSPKSGDTPLHVICFRQDYWIQVIAEGTRFKIVQALLQHGATFRENGAGLTPVHVAALSDFAYLVEFLISEQCSGSNTTEADKVTSLEMLGFSKCMNTSYGNGYDTLCKVISQRCHVSESGADPELEAIFQCTEKYSLADINAIKDDKRAMKIQWFLIGDRIIPAGAKGVYLFRPLAKFACECMQHDEATRGYNIFKYLMSSESHSKAVLGTVMEGISHFFEDGDTQDTKVVTQGCEIVNEYRDVIQHVSNSSLVEHGPQLLRSFGRLLFDIAYNVSELELLESVIKTAEKVITKVRAAFSPSDLDKFKAGSLTYHIMWKQAETYCDEMFCGGLRMPSLNRVKRVLCKLFRYDDVTYVDDKNGTMLHVVLDSLNYERDKSLLVNLARILIRHGCPVNKVKDEDGLTPVNLLAMMKEDDCFDSDDEEDINELADLLSPTTSITTLEEMAARVIVQNKIPYHGFLPESICEMIDGETVVPDFRVLKTPEKSESTTESD